MAPNLKQKKSSTMPVKPIEKLCKLDYRAPDHLGKYVVEEEKLMGQLANSKGNQFLSNLCELVDNESWNRKWELVIASKKYPVIKKLVKLDTRKRIKTSLCLFKYLETNRVDF